MMAEFNLKFHHSAQKYFFSKHQNKVTLAITSLTWQQNDLSWSLNVEWIIKNPQFNGFLALFLLEAVEAMDVTFNQIQGS